MIVASFYAPRKAEERIRWRCDYDKLLMLVEASCRRFNLKHLIISDSIRPSPLETFLVDLPENLMQAFIFGQKRLLESSPEPVLFIGADCLIAKDPRELSEVASLGITLGPFSDCKMNMGAVWCNNPEICAKIWGKALESKPLEWGDDQRVVYSAIMQEMIKGLNINVLRCEDHNWAPDHINDNAGFPTVVHFRGPRKDFMLAWGKKYLDLSSV